MPSIGQRRLLPSVVVALAVALGACSSSAAQHACGSQVSDTDRALPALQGSLLDGSPFDTASLDSGTTVVNVWGSWCGPCRAEAAELAKAASSLSGDGVRFLGVDVRDSKAAAAAFEQEFATPYPSVFDDPPRLAAALGAASPPATFVVRDGRVVTTITGQTDAATIACAVGSESNRAG